MLKDRSMSAKRVASLPLMTRESVALHNTEEDLYVIIDDLVIDVTRFQKHHPGGKKPLQVCFRRRRILRLSLARDALYPTRLFPRWVPSSSGTRRCAVPRCARFAPSKAF